LLGPEEERTNSAERQTIIKRAGDPHIRKFLGRKENSTKKFKFNLRGFGSVKKNRDEDDRKVREEGFCTGRQSRQKGSAELERRVLRFVKTTNQPHCRRRGGEKTEVRVGRPESHRRGPAIEPKNHGPTKHMGVCQGTLRGHVD